MRRRLGRLHLIDTGVPPGVELTRADAPSAPSRCGKRGQQVRRWLERAVADAPSPPLTPASAVLATCHRPRPRRRGVDSSEVALGRDRLDGVTAELLFRGVQLAGGLDHPSRRNPGPAPGEVSTAREALVAGSPGRAPLAVTAPSRRLVPSCSGRHHPASRDGCLGLVDVPPPAAATVPGQRVRVDRVGGASGPRPEQEPASSPFATMCVEPRTAEAGFTGRTRPSTPIRYNRTALEPPAMHPTLVSRDRATQQFAHLRDCYHAHRRPIPVSFRSLVSEIGLGERLTHRLHSYPATLLRCIPAFFLAVPPLTPDGSIIGDPFCGSGTVLLESMCAGFDSYGLDVNPLAALISRVKTRRLAPARLAALHRTLLRHHSEDRDSTPPPVVNMQHWFYPNVIRQLSQIAARLQTLPTGAYGDFFRACFSSCVRRVSLTNPRVSVPVRLRPDTYPKDHALHRALTTRLDELRQIDVWSVFSQIIEDNQTRVGRLSTIREARTSTIRIGDARDWNFQRNFPSTRCSLLITSPPYLGAQKYVRATSLSLNWLRLSAPHDLRPLERITVGREHINKDEYISFDGLPRHLRRTVEVIAQLNPLRAQIAAHYIADLRRFFHNVCTWLAPKGHCILVIGPNTVCGLPFDTPAAVLSIASDYGLSLTLELVDTIRSRGLMTRRNRNAATINREHVLVFQHTGR